MIVDASHVVSRAPDVASVEMLPGRIVVMSLDRMEPLCFEGTACEIWRLVDGTRSIREIASEIAAGADASIEAVEQSCGDFVSDLVAEGILATRPPDGRSGRGQAH